MSCELEAAEALKVIRGLLKFAMKDDNWPTWRECPEIRCAMEHVRKYAADYWPAGKRP